MGLVTAAAIVGGATVASGMMQASAQGKMAKAQQSAADRMRAEALMFAAPTSQELDNLTKQVDLYQRMYAQQTATIDQLQKQITDVYGPAILEQGKIFYDQLKGQSSGVVKSFDNQRDRQRKQLQAQLVERMGPGALTSSAGVNAMNDFDQKTSDMRAGIEEQSLNSALNRVVALSGGQDATSKGILNSYNSMSSLLNNIQTGYGNIQTRQSQAAMGTAAPVISSAGSQYVGEMGMAKALGAGFQQAGQIYALGSMGGGGGARAGAMPEGGFETQPFDMTVDPNLGYRQQANPNVSLLGGEPTFGDFTFNTGT
jgi:hypothetical protein